MAMAQPPKSVSQSMDDDECGSFIVVQRWSSSPNHEVAVPDADGESADEQFSDAAAELGSSETLANSLPADDMVKSASPQTDTPVEKLDGAAADSMNTIAEEVRNPPFIPMSQSQESEGTFMMDEERFSMTNYSSASSSSEQQLEEAQTKLSQVINDHKSLLELLEKQNMELEFRKDTIEELKHFANESVTREKKKSEESRRIVEKLTNERDSAVQKLEAASEAVHATNTVNARGFDAIQTLENQLRQRDQIIQQNGEQIMELSTRLHQEIVKSGETAELLRIKEEEDRVKRDSLSSSDEALAKSLSEKERMEQELEESKNIIKELQQEILNKKVALDNCLHLQTVAENLDRKCAALDGENREMQIKFAALQAEKEHQTEMFQRQFSQTEQLLEEKATLQRDLGRLNEMLQARTQELHNLQNQGQATSPMSGSVSGNLFGFLKHSARSFGLRDANDDPNEPFQQEQFEHVGAHAVPLQPTPAPMPVGFQCPICLKRFDVLRKLELHASDCGMDNAINSDPFVFP